MTHVDFSNSKVYECWFWSARLAVQHGPIAGPVHGAGEAPRALRAMVEPHAMLPPLIDLVRFALLGRGWKVKGVGVEWRGDEEVALNLAVNETMYTIPTRDVPLLYTLLLALSRIHSGLSTNQRERLDADLFAFIEKAGWERVAVMTPELVRLEESAGGGDTIDLPLDVITLLLFLTNPSPAAVRAHVASDPNVAAGIAWWRKVEEQRKRELTAWLKDFE